MSKKVLIVIDVSNIYYCVLNRLKSKVDYEQLMEFLKSYGDIYRAIAYGSNLNGEADSFITVLKSLGYEPKYKEPRIYPPNHDTTKSEIRKANWDVGIAMDVVRILPNVDSVVIISGDGDLSPLADYVKEQGKLCYCLGCQVSMDLSASCLETYEMQRGDPFIKTARLAEVA